MDSASYLPKKNFNLQTHTQFRVTMLLSNLLIPNLNFAKLQHSAKLSSLSLAKTCASNETFQADVSKNEETLIYLLNACIQASSCNFACRSESQLSRNKKKSGYLHRQKYHREKTKITFPLIEILPFHLQECE